MSIFELNDEPTLGDRWRGAVEQHNKARAVVAKSAAQMWAENIIDSIPEAVERAMLAGRDRVALTYLRSGEEFYSYDPDSGISILGRHCREHGLELIHAADALFITPVKR